MLGPGVRLCQTRPREGHDGTRVGRRRPPVAPPGARRSPANTRRGFGCARDLSNGSPASSGGSFRTTWRRSLLWISDKKHPGSARRVPRFAASDHDRSDTRAVAIEARRALGPLDHFRRAGRSGNETRADGQSGFRAVLRIAIREGSALYGRCSSSVPERRVSTTTASSLWRAVSPTTSQSHSLTSGSRTNGKRAAALEERAATFELLDGLLHALTRQLGHPAGVRAGVRDRPEGHRARHDVTSACSPMIASM